MPPAIQKINWLPILGIIVPILTFACGIIYASGVKDSAVKVEIEQIKQDIKTAKSDHDLLVAVNGKLEEVSKRLERVDFIEVRTRVDEMVKRLERIESKIDAR